MCNCTRVGRCTQSAAVAVTGIILSHTAILRARSDLQTRSQVLNLDLGALDYSLWAACSMQIFAIGILPWTGNAGLPGDIG